MFKLSNKNQTFQDRISMVRTFHEVFGAAVFEEPTAPKPHLQMVRLQLGVEELGELALALGKGEKHKALDGLVDLEFVCIGQALSLGLHQVIAPTRWKPRPERPWVDSPDHLSNLAASDLLRGLSVLSGHVCGWTMNQQIGSVNACSNSLANIFTEIDSAYNTLGLSQYRFHAFHEVFMSNMTKLGEDGKPVVNTAGRIVKGPNYQEPDLLGVIQFVDSQIDFEA
jgi:predicted HAD superfamily Cof-like phosphohydrolase